MSGHQIISKKLMIGNSHRKCVNISRYAPHHSMANKKTMNHPLTTTINHEKKQTKKQNKKKYTNENHRLYH